MIKYRAASFCTALLTSLASPASAATVDTLFFGLAGARTDAPSKTFGLSLQERYVLGSSAPLLFSQSGSATDSGNAGSASSSATHSVNGQTGQMRIGVQAAANPSSDGRGEATSTVQLVLAETFFVIGSGRLTAGLEFSASWNALDFETAGHAFIDPGTLSSTDNQAGAVRVPGTDEIRFNPSISGAGAGSATKLITFDITEIFAPAGAFIDVFWSMQAYVGIPGGGAGTPAEIAFIDAMNTSSIFFRTDDGLSAFAQTPGFLSDPAFGDPSPVPLPAPAFLLFTAIGGLFIGRRRFRVELTKSNG